MKYEITDQKHKKFDAYRIRALEHIIIYRGINGVDRIKKGEFGGYIGKDVILSQEGSCWVDSKSILTGRVIVIDSAYIAKSEIHCTCTINGNSRIINQKWKSTTSMTDFAFKDSYISGKLKINYKNMDEKCRPVLTFYDVKTEGTNIIYFDGGGQINITGYETTNIKNSKFYLKKNQRIETDPDLVGANIAYSTIKGNLYLESPVNLMGATILTGDKQLTLRSETSIKDATLAPIKDDMTVPSYTMINRATIRSEKSYVNMTFRGKHYTAFYDKDWKFAVESSDKMNYLTEEHKQALKVLLDLAVGK
jgi:hypothetical protein